VEKQRADKAEAAATLVSGTVIVMTDSRRPGDPAAADVLRRLRALPGLGVEDIPGEGPLEVYHRGSLMRGRSMCEFVGQAERLLGEEKGKCTYAR